MKKVTMFYFPTCPYCAAALNWMAELKAENAEYAKVEVDRIDEKKNPAIADKYDYFYVPTFFIDGVKIHEGAATREIVEDVLRRALEAEGHSRKEAVS